MLKHPRDTFVVEVMSSKIPSSNFAGRNRTGINTDVRAARLRSVTRTNSLGRTARAENIGNESDALIKHLSFKVASGKHGAALVNI
jgi:hypothetical protein